MWAEPLSSSPKATRTPREQEASHPRSWQGPRQEHKNAYYARRQARIMAQALEQQVVSLEQASAARVAPEVITPRSRSLVDAEGATSGVSTRR